MEIFKVGDEISIAGYNSITLASDMQTNIANFAKANGIDKSEAERILNSHPAIRNFIANLHSEDEEEDYIITGDFTNDLKTNKTATVNPALLDNSADAIKKSTQKASATSEPTAPYVYYADPSSPNSNNVTRNLLGVFGISITSNLENLTYDNNNRLKSFVLDGKTYELVYSGNKVTGFNVDQKEYRVVFDNDGAIKETQIKDEYGKLTRRAYPPDPLEQYYIDVEVGKDLLLQTVMPYISIASSDFTNYDAKRIKDLLDEVIEEFKKGNCSTEFYTKFLKGLGDKLGFNVSSLKNTVETGSNIAKEILGAFHSLESILKNGQALEKEAKKWTTKYVTLNGIKFKIKYLKSVGENPCNISISNGKILISGNNCTVDVLGFGSYTDNIEISGESIVVNCNATTFGSVTNNAKNSTITGSYGNDNITNTRLAVGTTINTGDGDDTIINRAKDATLNGQNGNDTFINYANATINGGNGDDVVNMADTVRTNIIPSEGNDRTYTFHVEGLVTPDPDPDPEDPEYPYSKTFTECGVTFIVYSKDGDFSGITHSSYKHLVTINANDVKIKVISKTHDDTRIKLEGNSLKFSTNVTLSSVFNYADNSTIAGSGGDDALFNYANNVTVSGLDGKDRLINEGRNVTLSGGEKEDHIYNRQSDETVTIPKDDSDRIFNESSTPTRISIAKGSMSDKDYNFKVTWTYIENSINNTSTIIDSTVTQSVYNNIQSLLFNLFTTTNGKKEFSSTATKLINYARNKSTENANKTDFELLKTALTEADTTSDGNITSDELTAFISKISDNGGHQASSSNVLGYNLPNLKNATLESLSTSLKSAIGLTDSQMSAFINAQQSNTEALKILKQIQTIINMGENLSVSLLDNIKSMMTDNTFDFNNEILADAQMVIEALESDDYNTTIKNKMIFNGSNLTDSQILAQTKAGEVIQKADGKLYVNTGSSFKELNISADTYISLFPPIGRYFIEQNDYEDCFFLATALIEGMENGQTRAVLLQMFSEDSSGNITIKFPNIEYPVTFNGGQLKETDGKWNQVQSGSTVNYDWSNYNRETTPLTSLSKGLLMLEQAYALAKFAELSNANITYETIKEYYSEPLAAAVDDARITDTSTLDMDKALLFYYKGGFDYNVYEDLYGTTSDEHKSFTDCTTTAQKEAILQAAYANSLKSNSVMTTRILGDVSKADQLQYNLGGGHQYAIEKIDTVNKIVYVKNPWESYMVAAVPYDVFFKYFSDIFYRTI